MQRSSLYEKVAKVNKIFLFLVPSWTFFGWYVIRAMFTRLPRIFITV